MGGKNHIEWTLDGLGIVHGNDPELFARILATGFGNLESSYLVAGILQLLGAVSPGAPILKQGVPLFNTQLCQQLEVRLIVTRPAAELVCEQSLECFIVWHIRGESLLISGLIEGLPQVGRIPRNSVKELAGWTTPQGGEEIFSVDRLIRSLNAIWTVQVLSQDYINQGSKEVSKFPAHCVFGLLPSFFPALL